MTFYRIAAGVIAVAAALTTAGCASSGEPSSSATSTTAQSTTTDSSSRTSATTAVPSLAPSSAGVAEPTAADIAAFVADFRSLYPELANGRRRPDCKPSRQHMSGDRCQQGNQHRRGQHWQTSRVSELHTDSRQGTGDLRLGVQVLPELTTLVYRRDNPIDRSQRSPTGLRGPAVPITLPTRSRHRSRHDDGRNDGTDGSVEAFSLTSERPRNCVSRRRGRRWTRSTSQQTRRTPVRTSRPIPQSPSL